MKLPWLYITLIFRIPASAFGCNAKFGGNPDFVSWHAKTQRVCAQTIMTTFRESSCKGVPAFMSANINKGTTAELSEWAAGYRLEDTPDVVVQRMKALV